MNLIRNLAINLTRVIYIKFFLICLLIISNVLFFTSSKTLSNEHKFAIWVVDHGYHSGLILPIDRISKDALPARSLYEDYNYIEIGWGDSGFYQANEITFAITIKALFWPTPSLMHLVAFKDHPNQYFSGSELISIKITQAQLDAMLVATSSQFARTNGIEPSEIERGEGLYGHSRFYAANDTYWIGRTCNHWTAEILNISGEDLSYLLSATSAGLMWQINEDD